MRSRSGALAAAFFISFLAAGLTQAADPAITPAPAFTAQQLLAQPRNAWVTNGGTLYNQRYSPLSLINRDNVKNLRALWRTGMGSGTTPGHAGQAQILSLDGVLHIVPEGATLVPGTGELPNKGRIFTPFWDKPISSKPGTMGGANWPPSSYDPESHLLYVCASDRISDFVVRLPLETPGPNKVYMGGQFTQAQVDDSGVFAALDVTTNTLRWRQEWREICYSGSAVTAGGLVFTGRADGRLTALDKATGAKLWEFMTDAGVNTTVTTFEHKGRQLVVVHAGGGAFANGKRGDGIWMFSLDGKIGPIVAGAGDASGPRGPGGDAAAVVAAPSKPLDLAAGEAIYKAACLACHGVEGTGGHGGGPTLIGNLDAGQMRLITTTGRNNMPTFKDVYDMNQIRDVSEYITSTLPKGAGAAK